MRSIMEDDMKMTLLGLAIVLAAAGAPGGAAAAEIKVLTAGAFKQVLVALVPDFEKQTGHKVIVENETVGALTKRIEGGESLRRRGAHAGGGQRPDRQRQVRGRQPRQPGARRRRRDGEGRRAGARHQHGRCVQARAARRQVGRLYRSGERRLERHLRRGPARQARHRRSGEAEGQAQAGRLRRRSHRQAARPSSASTRSARSCRSRK